MHDLLRPNVRIRAAHVFRRLVPAVLGDCGYLDQHAVGKVRMARVGMVVREDAEELAGVRPQRAAAQVERPEPQQYAAERHAHHGVERLLQVHLSSG